MSDKQHDEHVYDGIRELDNPMPKWWVAVFFCTIGWTYLYIVQNTTPGESVLELYATEMQERAAIESKLALAGDNVSDETLAALGRDKVMMAEAKSKFVATCSVCHGESAQGLIGPNLTDDYWKNCDGDLLAIYRIVDKGVPAKGMPAWGRQLSPTELKQLAAFVGTMRSTNVAGGKPPEGHLVQAAVTQ
jgi:cytochrome c oxidase cbb3-type subunit 3